MATILSHNSYISNFLAPFLILLVLILGFLLLHKLKNSSEKYSVKDSEEGDTESLTQASRFITSVL